MSGVNISYEIVDSDGGEIKYYDETSLSSKEEPNLANVIAGEIVNEILENALDIATRASETGIHWREIKESSSNSRASVSSLVSVTDSKSLKYDVDEIQMDTICTNIVGDIVEHIGIPSPPHISEIMDGLNSISVNQDTQQNKQEVVPLDVEMKKLLIEMLSPPYEIVNYDTLPVKGGVGDQSSDEKPENVTNGSVAEPEVSRAIEKKSRVTDLIKNSPQIISEYLLMDEHAKQNQEAWEESEEQLLQVIELDYVKPGEELFRVQKKNLPEKIALPEDDDDLILMPRGDDIMDIVDLSVNAFKEEERQLTSSNENSTGAKGDERKGDNRAISMTPHESASSGGEIIENSPVTDQKEVDLTRNNSNVKEQMSKKKKWNFGTRLFGFLKKGHKPQQGSSTST